MARKVNRAAELQTHDAGRDVVLKKKTKNMMKHWQRIVAAVAVSLSGALAASGCIAQAGLGDATAEAVPTDELADNQRAEAGNEKAGEAAGAQRSANCTCAAGHDCGCARTGRCGCTGDRCTCAACGRNCTGR